MKRRGFIIALAAMVVALSGCTSAQYGYDDVYDNEYPVYIAASKDKPAENYTNERSSNRDYGNYDAYEEDDYEYYGRNYSGSYSSRLKHFYGPTISISYYSGFYTPYYYGGYNSYYYNNYYDPWYSPYSWYNSYNYDPYWYHIHHYHHHHGYSPWYGYNNWYGYSPFNNYYGYNGYCPPNYGYGDYNSAGSNTYYGPRPNYSGYSNSTQPASNTTTSPLNPNVKTMNYDNGIKGTITIKNNTPVVTPSNDNENNVTPKINTAPRPVQVNPPNEPRPGNNNNNTVSPRPRYTKPVIGNTPQNINQPRPNNQPKPNNQEKPTIKPRSYNNSSGPKFNTTPRPSNNNSYSKPKTGQITGGSKVKSLND